MYIISTINSLWEMITLIAYHQKYNVASGKTPEKNPPQQLWWKTGDGQIHDHFESTLSKIKLELRRVFSTQYPFIDLMEKFGRIDSKGCLCMWWFINQSEQSFCLYCTWFFDSQIKDIRFYKWNIKWLHFR